MELGLKGKVAIITGASRGIGEAIAKEFLAEGCRVAICARDNERLQQTAAALRQGGGEVLALATDVTDAQAVGRLAQAVNDQWGRIDILVNNAGTHLRGTVEDTSLSTLESNCAIRCSGFF